MITKKENYWVLTRGKHIQYEIASGRLEIYENLIDAKKHKRSNQKIVEITIARADDDDSEIY